MPSSSTVKLYTMVFLPLILISLLICPFLLMQRLCVKVMNAIKDTAPSQASAEQRRAEETGQSGQSSSTDTATATDVALADGQESAGPIDARIQRLIARSLEQTRIEACDLSWQPWL